MGAQIRILQATLVIFLPHLFLKSLQLAACLPCIFPRWLWFIASPWIHVLSHCLLSLPTVFMYCLPHLLCWLAQALSENSRHLCIYLRFTYPSVSSCSIQTFCRNPPSIYATSLVSDFSFSSESMSLLRTKGTPSEQESGSLPSAILWDSGSRKTTMPTLPFFPVFMLNR